LVDNRIDADQSPRANDGTNVVDHRRWTEPVLEGVQRRHPSGQNSRRPAGINLGERASGRIGDILVHVGSRRHDKERSCTFVKLENAAAVLQVPFIGVEAMHE